MSGKENQMFELKIMQRVRGTEQTLTFYFENTEEMFIFVHSAIANSRNETEYAIRVLEEGEVIE